MNIFQKLSFFGKVQRAITTVKNRLKHPHTEEVENRISGGINKVVEGLRDIKREVPETTGIVNLILKEIMDE